MDKNAPGPSSGSGKGSRSPLPIDSNNWCFSDPDHENLPPPPPPIQFSQGSSIAPIDNSTTPTSSTFSHHVTEPEGSVNDVGSGSSGGAFGGGPSPSSSSYSSARRAKLDLLLTSSNNQPDSIIPSSGGDEEDGNSSSFHNNTASKDESSFSNSSPASDARISSPPLCSGGQVPEHTLSDISGPCSSSIVDKVPGSSGLEYEDDKGPPSKVMPQTKKTGLENEGSTTTSTTSLSDSDTEETEDHREFCLSRVGSRKGSADVDLDPVLDPDVVPMTVDTCEDYWTRLHDVRINGCILEYAGIGKSIHDNGFAQSNVPLTPLNHYFEITILDPGENCYIAIGLARKDYNVRKNPGWCRGSIAYHADDGKIFIGGGVGTPFGPRCSIRDVLGCGIMFPVKYGDLPAGTSWPWELEDTDTSTSKSAKARLPSSSSFRHRRRVREYNVDNFGEISSESEDDIWWNNRNQVCEDKVQVFFMRNRKLLGIKEVRIPKGGFYPTIGMMSTNERVSVDLQPLTG